MRILIVGVLTFATFAVWSQPQATTSRSGQNNDSTPGHFQSGSTSIITVQEQVSRDSDKKTENPDFRNALSASFDKFDNNTIYKIDSDVDLLTEDGGPELKFNAIYFCHGKSRCRPPVVSLFFSVTSHRWQFLRADHSLTLLVDGRRLQLGETHWNDQVLGYGH